MENYNAFVNDESWNGYALVEGVLVAVKAETIDISQTTRGKRIRINCTDGKKKYRVHPENYFDVEAYGRDIRIEGTFIYYNGHVWECLNY